MKSSDRTILVGVAVLGLLAAAWFMLLSPKRAELTKLNEEVAELELSAGEQEQLALAGEAAKASFDANYHRLVVLGKAVPGDDDTASLLVQTSALAGRAGLEFRTLNLSAGGVEAPAPPTAAAETTADAPAGLDPSGAAAPAPATEAAAATLPIGATVGAAGLPVMPYDLTFKGQFFDIVDFLAALDKQVRVVGDGGVVDGRLMTVDGFSLKGSATDGFPHLDASLHVTTFVAPADQGLTAGATPAAPPASVPAEPVPVSAP